MTDQGRINLLWADALIDGLAAAGVHRMVISPGSRSTPLVLAASRHPRIRIWTQVDERCAAFFALGLAKDNPSPVALVATSGSAPTHWYPAVVEANHSGIPLILLSADRPAELHNCGANQTINQTDLFNQQVRGFFDPGPARPGESALAQIKNLGIQATQLTSGVNPGPVHINLPLREPLLPEQIHPPQYGNEVIAPARPEQTPDPRQIERLAAIITNGSGIIICGPSTPEGNFAPVVTELARRLRVPILADPLSNLRFGVHAQSNILCHYDAFLRRRDLVQQNRPDWVLRFGAMPVSAVLAKYLEHHAPSTILCAPRGDWPDPLHQTHEMVRADPVTLCNQIMAGEPKPGEDEWLDRFKREEERVSNIRLDNDSDQPCEDLVVEELIQALPAASILFCSNSLPIRQLDSWSGAGTKPIRLTANRGVSGIDGNISTMLGIAASSSASVFGLLGDLACYHDMNGLLAATGMNGVMVVLNNNGGGIFGYLPQANLEQFEQHWLTPTNLDFSKIAALYSLHFQRVTSQSRFAPALASAMQESGLSLIEVVIDREQSLARHRAYWDRVSAD